jgi:(2Fe-2S) ferredoxin
MIDDNPTRRRKRLVVCRGIYCNEGRRADKNLRVLQPLLDDLNADDYPPPIKLEIANCLSMCGAGPNLVVYPENIPCNHVDEDDIAAIVDQYLRD